MKRILWVVLGVTLVTAGCADPIAPATPTPVSPTVAETFSDTLIVGGSNLHLFTVTAIGGVKVTLPSLQPSAAVAIGVGTLGVGTCSLIDHLETVAGPGVQMSGTITVPGQYCVEIIDIGNLVEPAVYTITVLHS